MEVYVLSGMRPLHEVWHIFVFPQAQVSVCKEACVRAGKCLCSAEARVYVPMLGAMRSSEQPVIITAHVTAKLTGEMIDGCTCVERQALDSLAPGVRSLTESSCGKTLPNSVAQSAKYCGEHACAQQTELLFRIVIHRLHGAWRDQEARLLRPHKAGR